jgi:hypothetical protein
MWDQVWHVYKKTRNYSSSFVLLILLGHKQENRFQSIHPMLYASNIFVHAVFGSRQCCSHRYKFCHIFKSFIKYLWDTF